MPETSFTASPRVVTGLDRLLADPAPLAGRRYGLLAHAASLTHDLRPAHLALAARGCAPAVLFGPEHGFYGIEQDMVPAAGQRDPWTNLPILSLYGETADSLRPQPAAFTGLDLLVVDLQDVGCRYYTYAASAVWAAEAALAAGCDVWVLDRPNPLGGEEIEGSFPAPGYESFVGAFRAPVRHGLTIAELFRLEGRRWERWPGRVRLWELAGWRRSMLWRQTGRPWVAPSPNMPTPETALLYPGTCLVEATTLSEGRGTSRPFQLVGGPGIDPVLLAERLRKAELAGVAFVPTFFRPQYQKHAGLVCGGVEMAVTDAAALAPYRTGVELLAAVRETAPEVFAWRPEPYEFVADRPAIDLLTGSDRCRRAVEGGVALGEWVGTWRADEVRFREERRAALLYPPDPPAGAEAA